MIDYAFKDWMDYGDCHFFIDILHIRSYTSNMQGYINRLIENKVKKNFKHIPAVIIPGPRQCGKSTLAKKNTNESL